MKSSQHFEEKDLTGFTLVCSLNELKEGSGRRFILDDIEVALFKIKDRVYALSNVCPHQHTALIYEGFIENGCVVCPAHGWTFSLETGKALNEGGGLNCYEVRINNNQVYVKVYKKNLNW